MPLTVGAARAQVLDYLDDESGDRFARVAGVTDYTKIDRFLRAALDVCLDAYRGSAFDEKITATSSANDGSVSLVSQQIRKIRGVLYAPTSTSFTQIDPGDGLIGYRPDLAARDLTLVIVRRFPIDDVPSPDDLLLGAVEGAARSWDAFDQWVCLVAATLTGIKGNEKRGPLEKSRDFLGESIKSPPPIPQARPWGSAHQPRRLSVAQQLAWLWTGRTQTLQLIMGGN